MPQRNDGHGPTDGELVRRARSGDEGAFCLLVDRHARRLYGLARSLLGNASDAEDVVQETLLGTLKGLGRFRGEASVGTWMTRILVNTTAKLRRTRSRRPAQALDDACAGGVYVPTVSGGSPAADARMDVSAVLDHLSQEHRTVIVLRELQGMSYDEIASAVGVPRGTVESRLFRARKQLKDLLKDYLP